MTEPGWYPIHRGTGDGAVLVVDFGGRSGAAGFARLATELAGPDTFYQTVPPHRTGPLVDPERYVAPWLSALPGLAARHPVRAVFTFCSGVGFLQPIAEALGPEVPAVAFDPDTVTDQDLTDEFHTAVGRFRAHLSEDEIAAARPDPAEDLGTAYLKVVALVAPRLGLNDHLAAALSGRFADYVGYLAHTRAAARRWPPAPGLVISSTDHGTAAGREVLRVEHDRATFLTAPPVLDVVARLLARREGLT